MNSAHLHLVVNHFPIIGLIIGFIILLIGLIIRSSVSKRVGLFTLLGSIVAVFPSFKTGEGAEETAEHLPGVKESLIERHEEIAEQFMVFAWIIIPLILVGLYADWKQKKFLPLLHYVIAIVSLVAIIFAKQVGTTGGEIRHTEIRNDQISDQTINSENHEKEYEDIED